MANVSRDYADQIAKDRGEAMDELERRNTPTPVPAASERMTNLEDIRKRATIPTSLMGGEIYDLSVKDVLHLLALVDKQAEELALYTAQLAGERKNIAGWIAARDAQLERAEFAVRQLDESLDGHRLKEDLIRTITARAEAAEARAETAWAEALEEAARLLEVRGWNGAHNSPVQMIRALRTAPPPTGEKK